MNKQQSKDQKPQCFSPPCLVSKPHGQLRPLSSRPNVPEPPHGQEKCLAHIWSIKGGKFKKRIGGKKERDLKCNVIRLDGLVCTRDYKHRIRVDIMRHGGFVLPGKNGAESSENITLNKP